jgi:beta-glucosidase
MRPLEEYELTQHYQQWEHDFALAESLGVRAIRWGIPWYRVQPEPDRFDWEWTDRALETLVEQRKLIPILDLMHYGTPLWLENSFINASYPERVAEYAAAVAKRYKGLVQVYTPLNEPMVNADLCGRKSEWPPYLEGEDGYVKLLLALSRGIVKTTEALRAEQPDALLVQVEALWHFWAEGQEYQSHLLVDNQRQYLSFDLCTGQVGEDYPLLSFLHSNGVREDDLDWFRQHAVQFDVFGANFYPWSYGELRPDEEGRLRRISEPATHGSALGEVVSQAYARYNLPVMVTETSANAPQVGRARWMDETIAAMWRLRERGIPVIGYTWFPMMTMVDWSYRPGDGPVNDYLIHLGLFDSFFDENGVLRRQRTPLAERYREFTRQPVPPLPAEM